MKTAYRAETRPRHPLVLALHAVLATGPMLPMTPAWSAQTTRVSVDSAGASDAGWSDNPALSADGQFVAFVSYASTLVAGDTNGQPDVFVRNRTTGQVTRVSVDSAGNQGNGASYSPALSADGRFVVFSSAADNLVAGDINETRGVFVHDRLLNPATTADLTVPQTMFANPVPKGATFSYTATVTNLGPDNATNVVLTVLAPLHTRVRLPFTLSPRQGSCTKGPISICRLDTLNVGQQATVQVIFKTLQAGTAANRISVSASGAKISP